MKFITTEEVLMLHRKMIDATGGEDGIRDRGLLESALNNAFATFDGIDLYQTIEEKCVNICYCMINNHPFIDGNKRTGIFVMLVLLEYNGLDIRFTNAELVELGTGIAKGEYKQGYILNWIIGHKVE